MSEEPSRTELELYLDEALPPEEMARIEEAVRGKPELVRQLAAINSRRDHGVHSLGDVWRRHRLTCPSREQLGSFLLGVLPDEEMEYLEFHLKKVGCRLCQASAEDLRLQQEEASDSVATRRRRYFQSSAGLLRKQ